MDNKNGIEPLDALTVINRLNSVGPGSVPADAAIGFPAFYDTDGNGEVEPLDALRVINHLNSQIVGGGGGGEGEAAGEPSPSAGAGDASVAAGPLPGALAPEELLSLLAFDLAEHSTRRRARNLASSPVGGARTDGR